MGRKVWNPEFTKIFCINLMNAIGFHILTPILPKYVVSLGYSGVAAGIIGTAFTLTAILVRCFASFFSNENRQRGMLIVSLFIIAVATLGYALTDCLEVLVAFRFLHGVGWGVATMLTAAAAVRALPAEKVGGGIGLFGLGSVVGQALAPNLGLNLVETIGYPPTFVIAMILPAAAAAVCFAFRPVKAVEPTKKQTPQSSRALRSGVILPSLLILFITFSVSCVSYFLALCAESRAMRGAGTFFTIYAFSLLFIRPAFGRLADHSTGKPKIFIPCACALILSLAAIAMTDNIWIWYAVALLYGIGYGGVQPVLQTWCVQSVPIEQCAFANSIFYSCFDLGSFLGSTVGGAIADRMGYAAMYLSMCLPLVLAIVLFLFIKPPFQQKREENVCL